MGLGLTLRGLERAGQARPWHSVPGMYQQIREARLFHFQMAKLQSPLQCLSKGLCHVQLFYFYNFFSIYFFYSNQLFLHGTSCEPVE